MENQKRTNKTSRAGYRAKRWENQPIAGFWEKTSTDLVLVAQKLSHQVPNSRQFQPAKHRRTGEHTGAAVMKSSVVQQNRICSEVVREDVRDDHDR